MNLGAHADVGNGILHVQVERHRQIIERGIAWNWNAEARRQLNRESSRHEREQAPIEMRFAVEALVILRGRAAVLGERQVRVTEKFLRDPFLVAGVDDFAFQAGKPLHRAVCRREADATGQGLSRRYGSETNVCTVVCEDSFALPPCESE